MLVSTLDVRVLIAGYKVAGRRVKHRPWVAGFSLDGTGLRHMVYHVAKWLHLSRRLWHNPIV